MPVSQRTVPPSSARRETHEGRGSLLGRPYSTSATAWGAMMHSEGSNTGTPQKCCGGHCSSHAHTHAHRRTESHRRADTDIGVDTGTGADRTPASPSH